MPNWVSNHLIIQGEKAEEIMKALLVPNRDLECGYALDFNKIIPMPEDLNIESGSCTRDCAKLYVNALDRNSDDHRKYEALYVQAFGKGSAIAKEEQEALMKNTLRHTDWETKEYMFATEGDVYAYGKKALDNYLNYGAKDWYDWCVINWGTKWNACDTRFNDINKADVCFDTAWTPPLPVIKSLSEQYPEQTFHFEFAEEQPGYYAGELMLRNGQIVKAKLFESQSKEAYEMYFKLWGDVEEYRFNEETGTYDNMEDGEETQY